MNKPKFEKIITENHFTEESKSLKKEKVNMIIARIYAESLMNNSESETNE